MVFLVAWEKPFLWNGVLCCLWGKSLRSCDLWNLQTADGQVKSFFMRNIPTTISGDVKTFLSETTSKTLSRCDEFSVSGEKTKLKFKTASATEKRCDNWGIINYCYPIASYFALRRSLVFSNTAQYTPINFELRKRSEKESITQGALIRFFNPIYCFYGKSFSLLSIFRETHRHE